MHRFKSYSIVLLATDMPLLTMNYIVSFLAERDGFTEVQDWIVAKNVCSHYEYDIVERNILQWYLVIHDDCAAVEMQLRFNLKNGNCDV